MLPDFPKIKNELAKAYFQIFKKMVEEYTPDPFLRQVQVFEGERTAIVREDGTKDENNPFKVESLLTISTEEIPTLRIEEVLKRLNEMAKQLSSERQKKLYQSLSDQLDKAGRMMEGKGRPLSAEVILEALDSVMITFDEKGVPQIPTLVIHPNLLDKAKAADAEFQKDPKLRARYDQIISKKREEWNAREATRRLVG